MRLPPDPVLILHHAVPDPGSGPSVLSDAGVMDEVRAVSAALDALRVPHRTVAVSGLASLPDLLRASPENTVFNLIESLPSHPGDAALVPSICETFGKACTGNDSACQSLCTDKWRTKAILQAAELPVPRGAIIPPGKTAVRGRLPKGRLIVKPLFADASEGIHADSVVAAATPALGRAVRRIHRDFGQPALVEQFFGSRELNVALLQRGHGAPDILPVAEIEFRGYGRNRPRIVDYAAKWHPHSYEYRNTVRVVPAKLPAAVAARVRSSALAAWEILGCADYARVDLRMDAAGNFVILEVNPNPDIAPESGFAAALHAAGIPFAAFVREIILNAQRRRRHAVRTVAPKSPKQRPSSDASPEIRYTVGDDRDAILQLMRENQCFREGEIHVAEEVLDGALKDGSTGHYQSFTLSAKGRPVGWVCLGPTPCTLGTFDIYWLGVSPVQQGKGYGRALMEHAEEVVRQRQGHLIVVETSGHALYNSTRQFYLSLGYREVARVADFYAPGDARVVYTKALH